MKMLTAAVLLCALLFNAAGAEDLSALEQFQQRAHLTLTPALRQRVIRFLQDFEMDSLRIRRMPEALIQAYARNLAAGLPLEYGALLTEDAEPFSALADGDAPKELLLLCPGDPMTECFLADFAQGACYYDSARDISADVCRAERFPAWTQALQDRLTDALDRAEPKNWQAEYAGDTRDMRPAPLVLALRTETGLFRLTARGRDNGLPESAQALIRSLTEIARAAE